MTNADPDLFARALAMADAALGTYASRMYLVSLPVAVTVSDDGTVVYEVDTTEAGAAVVESVTYVDSDNRRQICTWTQTAADREAIEADHRARRLA